MLKTTKLIVTKQFCFFVFRVSHPPPPPPPHTLPQVATYIYCEIYMSAKGLAEARRSGGGGGGGGGPSILLKTFSIFQWTIWKKIHNINDGSLEGHSNKNCAIY